MSWDISIGLDKVLREIHKILEIFIGKPPKTMKVLIGVLCSMLVVVVIIAYAARDELPSFGLAVGIIGLIWLFVGPIIYVQHKYEK